MTCIQQYIQAVDAAKVLMENTIALCGDQQCITDAVNKYTQAVQDAHAAYLACVNGGGGGSGS